MCSLFWLPMPTILWTASPCYTIPWIPLTSLASGMNFNVICDFRLWNSFHPTVFICIEFLVFHFLNGYIITMGACVVHVPKVIFTIRIWSWSFSMVIEILAQPIVSRFIPDDQVNPRFQNHFSVHGIGVYPPLLVCSWNSPKLL